MRPAKGRNLAGMLSHVLRPITTAFCTTRGNEGKRGNVLRNRGGAVQPTATACTQHTCLARASCQRQRACCQASRRPTHLLGGVGCAAGKLLEVLHVARQAPWQAAACTPRCPTSLVEQGVGKLAARQQRFGTSTVGTQRRSPLPMPQLLVAATTIWKVRPPGDMVPLLPATLPWVSSLQHGRRAGASRAAAAVGAAPRLAAARRQPLGNQRAARDACAGPCFPAVRPRRGAARLLRWVVFKSSVGSHCHDGRCSHYQGMLPGRCKNAPGAAKGHSRSAPLAAAMQVQFGHPPCWGSVHPGWRVISKRGRPGAPRTRCPEPPSPPERPGSLPRAPQSS